MCIILYSIARTTAVQQWFDRRSGLAWLAFVLWLLIFSSSTDLDVINYQFLLNHFSCDAYQDLRGPRTTPGSPPQKRVSLAQRFRGHLNKFSLLHESCVPLLFQNYLLLNSGRKIPNYPYGHVLILISSLRHTALMVSLVSYLNYYINHSEHIEWTA